MYDKPASNVPILNLIAKEGCFLPIFNQIIEITGANNKINNGLIDWNKASPNRVVQPNKLSCMSERSKP